MWSAAPSGVVEQRSLTGTANARGENPYQRGDFPTADADAPARSWLADPGRTGHSIDIGVHFEWHTHCSCVRGEFTLRSSR